jgi:imidazolonepropionase-like amidohydrolase
MLAGTDPVLPGMHGRNYMELVWLLRDGLSPTAAWYAGTGLAADQIGQGDSGQIIPGRRADLLVCQGDVIEQPDLLDQGALVEVIKDGVGYRGGLSGLSQKSFGHCVQKALRS